MKRTLVSWSSGKDSAWLLSRLQGDPDVDIVALVTTLNETVDRVAMHGVRHALLQQQARRTGLPVWTVPLPWPCSNEDYARRMQALIERAQATGITHMAFGDLYLEDIRDYRCRQLEGSGITPLFPLWCSRDDTPALARTMLSAGIRARISCIDAAQLDPAFAGAAFDAALLDALPGSVDPCGEAGEFHTVCVDAPCFSTPIAIDRGETVTRDGFIYTDWLPVEQEVSPA